MVTTSADRKVEQIIDHLKDSIDLLSEIVVDHCWGYDDFKDSFKETLRKSLSIITKIRNDLEP